MSAYTKTTWANNTTPAISASNLQHIEDFVQELSDDKYTGNGGQPPAPRPKNGIGVGNWNYAVSNLLANGQSGGTYAYIAFGTSGEFVGADAGQAQGINLSTVFGVTVAKNFYFRTLQ